MLSRRSRYRCPLHTPIRHGKLRSWSAAALRRCPPHIAIKLRSKCDVFPICDRICDRASIEFYRSLARRPSASRLQKVSCLPWRSGLRRRCSSPVASKRSWKSIPTSVNSFCARLRPDFAASLAASFAHTKTPRAHACAPTAYRHFMRFVAVLSRGASLPIFLDP